jgi:hypothetical protein
MSNSISGRTRTPAELKWLLNERAAIAGRIQKTEARQRSIEAQLPQYQRQLEKALRGVLKVKESLSEYQCALNALDTTIGLAFQAVRPDAAGAVNAWAGKYGHRGALTQFVAQLLREAAPHPVDARTVAARVAEHFAIPQTCATDRLFLRTSVKNAFKRLHEQGTTEALHSRVKALGTRPGIWRWKEPIPSLSELATKAQRMAQLAAEANDAGPTPCDQRGSAG